MDIEEKLQEYISLLDFNDEYLKKDYKNNLKFIGDWVWIPFTLVRGGNTIFH